MLNNQEIQAPALIQDLGMMYPTDKSTKKSRFGLYRCMCGTEFKAVLSNVTRGNTKSCGCHKSNKSIKTKTKHGLRRHRIYRIWRHMKNRTLNKNYNQFYYYGGKGVTICNEWINDVESFYNWSISNGYDDSLSIDRIDPDGNYEPSNCRWATCCVQSRNTKLLRVSNKSGYRGVYFSSRLQKWVSEITVSKKKKHIGNFRTAIEAAKAYDNYVISHKLEHTINALINNQV